MSDSGQSNESSAQQDGSSAQQGDQGLVSRVGPVQIDWPRSIGYFGGVALAVAYELIPPGLGIFIAAVPFLKLLKRPGSSQPMRTVSAVLEGAAKPVGGDSEATIELTANSQPSPARAPRRRTASAKG